MELLLHPQSRERYESFVSDPPQSILLIAPSGSGKETVLRQLANEVLGEHPAGRLFDIVPQEDKNSIGIESIRELKINFRLKSDKPRVVLISHAELLTQDAQNSFLKLLEEPPANVHFFMAATKLSDLLETIQSRTAVWRLILPTKSQIAEYFAEYPDSIKNKAMAIGESRVGLISALLSDDQNHELLSAIDTAKEILAENHFERLVRVDALSKNADQTRLLLNALELVCKAALEHAANNNSHTVKQWHKRLVLVGEAQSQVQKNVQTKLVLSYLFMRI